MKINKYLGTVFIDVDGVLADFEGEFCEAFGWDNRHLVSLEARYPDIDPDLIKEFENSPQTYEDLLPIFGGILLLNQVKDRGYYTVLLTSRPKHLAQVTREWLEGYHLEYNELWYSKHKAGTIHEYNEMYPHRKAILLVDDIPNNLAGLPEGVMGVVWEQPWNVGTFPRLRYNDQRLCLEVKSDTESKWIRF